MFRGVQPPEIKLLPPTQATICKGFGRAEGGQAGRRETYSLSAVSKTRAPAMRVGNAAHGITVTPLMSLYQKRLPEAPTTGPTPPGT